MFDISAEKSQRSMLFNINFHVLIVKWLDTTDIILFHHGSNSLIVFTWSTLIVQHPIKSKCYAALDLPALPRHVPCRYSLTYYNL